MVGPHAVACALVDERVWYAESSIYETAKLVVDRVHFAADHFELRITACFKTRGHALMSTSPCLRKLVCKGELQSVGEGCNRWYVIGNTNGRLELRWRLDAETGKIRNFTLSGLPLMLFFEPQRDDTGDDVTTHLGDDATDGQEDLDDQITTSPFTLATPIRPTRPTTGSWIRTLDRSVFASG
jgi:hypothetical protein